jgi:hypothetical protein
VTSEEVVKHHKTWLRDSFFYDRLTGVVRHGSTGKVTATTGLDLDAVARDTKRSDISGLAKIIIPINIRNSHWILASINIKSKTITLFDSMRESNPEVYMALHAWLKKLFPATEQWYEASGRGELQSPNDCGIHVMMNILSQALNILSDGHVSPAPPRIPDRLRSLVTHAMFTGRLQLQAGPKPPQRTPILVPVVVKPLHSMPSTVTWLPVRAQIPAPIYPPGTDLSVPAREKKDPFACVMSDTEMCSRYCETILRLMDQEDFDWDATTNEIVQMGDMKIWCDHHDSMILPPLT